MGAVYRQDIDWVRLGLILGEPNMKRAWLALAVLGLLGVAVGVFRNSWPCPSNYSMSAEEYWYLYSKVGNVWVESQTDRYLCVIQQLEEDRQRPTVEKAALEVFFRKKVASLIADLDKSYDPREEIEQLSKLTGEQFGSVEEWREWYRRNGDRLRLRSHGRYVVVRP